MWDYCSRISQTTNADTMASAVTMHKQSHAYRSIMVVGQRNELSGSREALDSSHLRMRASDVASPVPRQRIDAVRWYQLEAQPTIVGG